MIQDEIRDGIAHIIQSYYGDTIEIPLANDIVKYLDSKGCVISIPDSPDEPDDFYYGEKGPPIIKDGMAIVKPLIKE